MSVVGSIRKVHDRFSFTYGVSIFEGRYAVWGISLEVVKAEREKLLKMERCAGEIYGYYEYGYYKGRFESLKPLLAKIFVMDDVFYTWHTLDDWLWKLYEESVDLDHFAFGIIKFLTGHVKEEKYSRHACRTVKSEERKINYLEACLEEMGKTEVLCAVRLMKETGIRIWDLENILWDNIHFPYVSGVMSRKLMSLYPVTQISDKTYELLKKLKKTDDKVFHKKREVFSVTVRKAIAGEFEYGIHELRWYWLKSGGKIQAPDKSQADSDTQIAEE
ncbi:hypothetical protein [Enterocloster bolteae]|uniref:hypothetical protein n=1 Tax=Enterocloster bolteae TaxID=208479 RepID=UPI0028DB2593|nr:hypothetical protein [Enterocloster bolteae]